MAHHAISGDALDQPSTLRAPDWAWGVCWLMFASTVLNYMDRQAIALVSAPIKQEFALDNLGFGWVLAVFSMTYAVFQVPAGFLVDRGDVRKTYAFAVIWWSLAGMAAAFSPSLGLLMACRALLAIGESFNWPCALRTTSLILPPADRSLGNGIFNSGAAVGAVLTPLIVPWLTLKFGWRTSFLAIGSLGFLWVVAWLVALSGPRRHVLVQERKPSAREDELGPAWSISREAVVAFGSLLLICVLVGLSAARLGLAAIWWAIALLMFGMLFVAAILPEDRLAGNAITSGLGAVVRRRRFWVLVLVSTSINVCWHFLVSWMPTYLLEDRKMTLLQSGFWTAMPFLAADFGNLGGGALSRLLAARGLQPDRARITVMALCTLLISSGALIGLAQSDAQVILLLGLMATGTAAFMANYFAFTQDVLDRHTGLIVGILGGLGNLCAAGILPLAGLIKDRTGGFAPIFLLVAFLPFIGLTAMVLGWDRTPVAPAEKSV